MATLEIRLAIMQSAKEQREITMFHQVTLFGLRGRLRATFIVLVSGVVWR
jgi:hypothetical protein